MKKINEALLAFIKNSPTSFHAVREMGEELERAGYQRLEESCFWTLDPGGSYFVTRNQSSIIAFSIPTKSYTGFHIAASHSDSPSLKIKEAPEIDVEHQYVKLNVEKYGGLLCSP